MPLDGMWVVVTGASGGLGAALARELARRGARPVLVGRRRDRLDALAAELRARGGEAAVVVLDLAAPDAIERLYAAAGAEGRVVEGLVWCAGVHWFGDFGAMPVDAIEATLAVNALGPVRLVRRYLPELDARGRGGVLLVASTGGLMPAPRQAVYAASKALVVNFAQSLTYERGPDAAVPVCLCCPGAMPTEMLSGSPVMEVIARRRWMRAMLMDPARVARQAVDAFEAGAPLCIPGWLNKAMDRVTRLLPRAVAGRGAARVYPR